MERIKNYFKDRNLGKSNSFQQLQKDLSKEFDRFSSPLSSKCYDSQPKHSYCWMDAITADLYESDTKISGTNITYLAMKYGYHEDELSFYPTSKSFEIILTFQNEQNEALKRIISFSVDDSKKKLVFNEIRNNNTNEFRIEEAILDQEENTSILEQALLALKKFAPDDFKFKGQVS